MNLRSLFSVGLLGLVTCAAYGQSVNFTTTTGADTFTFSLPSSPTVSGTDCLGFLDNFCEAGVAVTFDGSPQTDEILFFDAVGGGGLGIFNNATSTWMLDEGGDLLFSGPDATPTFLLGTFNDDGFFSPAGVVEGPTTVTISSTPEPSTLMLLGSGMLGVIGAGRRRLRR